MLMPKADALLCCVSPTDRLTQLSDQIPRQQTVSSFISPLIQCDSFRDHKAPSQTS